MTRYHICIKGEGLIHVLPSSYWEGGLWALCTTRKSFVCVMSGNPYPKGTKAYRPLGNGRHRMLRLSEESLVRAFGDKS